MTNIERFKFLSIFGDSKSHTWFEVIYMGVIHLRVKQKYFEEKIFKKMLFNDLIKQYETDQIKEIKKRDSYILTWKDYEYIITPKGDECLRNEQIKRHGDVSYYKYYDRSVDGKWGLNHFAPTLKNVPKQQYLKDRRK